MTHEELFKEFAALPAAGQQQVEHLIVALRQTYAARQNEGQPAFSDWQAGGFLGMWHDRADMQDSTAWIRERRVASAAQ
jgi:hypothetical protein